MANGWTEARRARQAELIRTWKPWDKSTGPRTAHGWDTASSNPCKGGQRLRQREFVRAMSAEIKAAQDLMERIRG